MFECQALHASIATYDSIADRLGPGTPARICWKLKGRYNKWYLQIWPLPASIEERREDAFSALFQKKVLIFISFWFSFIFFGGRDILWFSVLMDPSTVNEESRRSSDMSTKPPQIHDRDHVRQLRSTSNAIFLQKLELSPPMTSPPGKIHRFLCFFLNWSIYISVCG